MKLDFEKTFDKVEHHVILDMFKHKGFSEKWISWIRCILSFGSSFVLLNGVPGTTFKCKRGVRHGDPLSPLLFVLATDLLQSMINQACSSGTHIHPLGPSFGGDFPIVQYDDGTLIIMPAEVEQLHHLHVILGEFASSTELKVNFSKSSLWLINVDDSKAGSLATAIGCRVGTMPFSYLGLPVGTTRPSVQEYMSMMNQIERRLMGISLCLLMLEGL